MDEKEDPLATLWEGLRSEAVAEEFGPADPFEPPALEPVRRHSLTEKFQSAVLSGYIPAFVVLVVGALVGCWGLALHEFPIFVAISGILAFPAAWLLSDLFRLEKLSLVRILILVILGGSLGALGLTTQPALLLSWWQVQSRSPNPRESGMDILYSYARFVDDLYLNHLQPSTWLVFGLLVLGLVGLVPVARRIAPWLESHRPSSIGVKTLALLLLLSPWLFIGTCKALKGRLAPAELAWLEAHPVPHVQRRRPDKSWAELLDRVRLADSSWARESNLTPGWSREFQQDVERRCLALAQTGKNRASELVTVADALLHRPGELEEPLELAWLSLEALLRQRPSGKQGQAARAGQVLLTELASRRFTALELQQQRKRLKTLSSPSRGPREELDFALSHLIESDWRREEVMPVSALALEFELKTLIRPWLEAREKVDFTNYHSFTKSLLASTAAMPKERRARWLIEYASRACYGLQLRPTFQTAELLLALRLYRAEHGRYPAKLTELSSLPDELELDYSYRTQGPTAQVGAELEKGKVTRWILP